MQKRKQNGTHLAHKTRRQGKKGSIAKFEYLWFPYKILRFQSGCDIYIYLFLFSLAIVGCLEKGVNIQRGWHQKNWLALG